jgi:hypothetical protein
MYHNRQELIAEARRLGIRTSEIGRLSGEYDSRCSDYLQGKTVSEPVAARIEATLIEMVEVVRACMAATQMRPDLTDIDGYKTVVTKLKSAKRLGEAVFQPISESAKQTL